MTVVVASHEEDRHLYVTFFGGAGGALSHAARLNNKAAAANILTPQTRRFDMSGSLPWKKTAPDPARAMPLRILPCA